MPPLDSFAVLRCPSWLGGLTLHVVGAGHRVRRIAFAPNDAPLEPGLRRADDAFDDARSQLEAYWRDGAAPLDLPLAWDTGTPKQQAVWRALTRIPAGQTRTYGELAADVGSVARAVGQANGQNPYALVVPCHRVVATQSLGGYFGGRLDLKRALLRHEGGLL